MKFLSTLLTFATLVLAAPTVLILASWNALPGDSLYPFKKGLETITLVATSATPLAPKFSVQFTDRRFSEANKLLATQGSTVGFALLAQEARATKEIIVEKSDSQTAGELIFKIEEYQENIVAQQQALATQVMAQPETLPVPQPPSLQPSAPTVTQPAPTTPTPVIEKPQTTPILLPKITEPVKAQEAVVKLEETRHDLEKIKDEIKKDLPEAAKRAKELQEEIQEKREEERQAKEEKEQKRGQDERED